MQLPDPTFSSSQIRELLAVTRRQLNYWAAKGHIEPSARPTGVRAAVYSLGDVVRVFFVTELLRIGYSTRKALSMETVFYRMAVHHEIRIDEGVTVLLDRKDRMLIVRGSWWPEANVELATNVVSFSRLFSRLAEAGIIL